MKKISIITVCYNIERAIERTILSVINQNYNHYEYIIIDGGSSDKTTDIIKKYSDRISYWVSEKDNGIYNAMNKGIKKASGDYLIFMNAGDSFHDNKVLSNIFSSEQNADIISGIALTGKNEKKWKPIKEKDLCLMFFYTSGLCHQATFIKKDLFKNCLYDENLKIVSDSKFFIQNIIFNNCSYKSIDTIVCRYELGGISSNIDKHHNELNEVFKDILPPRMYNDYNNNKIYNESPYDKWLKQISPFVMNIITLLRKIKQI